MPVAISTDDLMAPSVSSNADNNTVGRRLAPAALLRFAVDKEIIACRDTTHPPAEPVPLPFIKGRHVAAKTLTARRAVIARAA